ncbi:MAG TPA: rubrerythrin family protein [Caldisericia bacterium]|nr:rubrerythrin family protein [Caldisericia bacterium]HON84181.1 rubrerythrin family protein [Caldisericia bacterium]
MKKMTENFLKEAFAGESMAHMKYLIFSEIAEKEGYSNIARLFKAISYAEQVHATNHFKNLGNIGKTNENLQSSIDGETFEVEEMYPVYNNTAKLQEEKGAEISTHYALEAEKIHSELYKMAKDLAEKNKDIEKEDIYICPVCGFTHIGEPPDKCPVCGALKDKFKKF